MLLWYLIICNLWARQLISLIGEDGIGKSSLLWAVCQQNENLIQLKRNLVVIDLNDDIDSPNIFYEELFDRIGISGDPGSRKSKKELESKRTLLILDNIYKFSLNGVWGQAGENGNIQQIILSHLAKDTKGLNVNELFEFTEINETDLQTALEILTRHDVIAEKQGQWRIIVELFRRWVVKSHPLNSESGFPG